MSLLSPGGKAPSLLRRPTIALVVPFAATAVILLGVMVLTGWQFDNEALKRLRSEWVAMNPATALAFILAGTALLLAHFAPSRKILRIANALGALVALIGVLKLIAWAGGPELLVDQLLFHTKLNTTTQAVAGAVFTNRMAPNTALLFALVGAALALLRSKRTGLRHAPILLPLASVLVATLALIGYFDGVTALYRPTASLPIALHTVLGILALCAGILSAEISFKSRATRAHGVDARGLDRKITIGFGSALFLLAIIGVVSFASISNFAAANEAAIHSQKVLAAIAQIAADSTDAETGVRGYVITGQASFLEPHAAAMAAIGPDMAALAALVSDNPDQLERYKQLEILVENHRIVLANAIDAQRAGQTAQPEELTQTATGRAAMDAIRSALLVMRDVENDLQVLRAQQTQRTGRMTTIVISVGGLLAFVLVLVSGFVIRRDLEQRRKIDLELRLAHAAADAANQSKSSFLANMSHEIRTPMSAIIGYADLILDPHQTQSDRLEYVNTIRRNGDHLLTIINDVLDLSKIEAGKFQVTPAQCCPCRVLADVASLMRVRAAEKKIRFEVKNDGLIPATVTTDAARLRQILINLVGNAIKFTEEGWVRVIMKLEESPAQPPQLRFEVIDTGIGMNPQQISQLFQPFVQADDSATRRFGGTGLGLTISKRLVELLGGKVGVDSTPNRGSTFWFTIAPGSLHDVRRLQNCKEALAGAEVANPLNTGLRLEGRVLLVDDGEDNRRLLSVYLRQAGARVTLAENGRIGCDKALAALSNAAPYDVVLMDMQMPELDGYGATSLLRAKGYTGAIVALTAHAMAEDRDKCLNAGCTDYLSKPVHKDALLSTVARYIKSAREALAAEIASGHHVPASAPFSQAPIKSDLDDESMRSFLLAYISELPGRIAELQSCLDQGDMDALSARLHNLKGTGGLYGLMPITTAAGKADGLIQSKAPIEAIEAQVREVMQIIRRVEGFDANRARIFLKETHD